MRLSRLTRKPCESHSRRTSRLRPSRITTRNQLWLPPRLITAISSKRAGPSSSSMPAFRRSMISSGTSPCTRHRYSRSMPLLGCINAFASSPSVVNSSRPVVLMSSRPTATQRAPLQHQLVGLDIAAGRLVARHDGLAQQLDLERLGHSLTDLRLDREDVLQFLIVAVRPEAGPVSGADHADRDPDLVALLEHRALDQVGHLQRRADLRRAVLGVAKLEAGILADHLQSIDLGEFGDQLLGQAIGEILLLGVAAFIAERQHRDRGAA